MAVFVFILYTSSLTFIKTFDTTQPELIRVLSNELHTNKCEVWTPAELHKKDAGSSRGILSHVENSRFVRG
jgi:hypothetical protein